MNEQDRQKIARENRAEVQRAKTGLSGRDWSVVLGAVIVAILVLGFIYTANNPGNVEPALEPAAGNGSTTGGEAAAGLTPSAADTANPSDSAVRDTPDALDVSPNPAD